MKKIIIIILQLFSFTILFSLNQYESVLIKVIPVGIEDGKLNYIDQPGWKEGPRSFIIASDNKIYVDDGINQRIVIYASEIL